LVAQKKEKKEIIEKLISSADLQQDKKSKKK